MLKSLRTRVNTTTAIAVVALVFAMTGGAYAAGHYLITSTKQISPKVLKQLRGQAGSAGSAGLAGKEGPQGKEGALGKEGVPGKEGKVGADGINGTNGEGVTATKVETSSANCKKQGGSEFTVGSTTTFACNGQSGFTKTLPKGETEKGTWGYSFNSDVIQMVSISFPIPLAAELDEKHVHYIAAEQAVTAECPGSATEPEAAAGNLCVYEAGLGASLDAFQPGPPTNGIKKPDFSGLVVRL